MAKPKKPKIAYLLHMFPVLSETFIIDEILQLKKTGEDISIFSFARCSNEVIHKKAEELMRNVFYAPDPKSDVRSFIRVLMPNLTFFFRNPLRYIHSMFKYVSIIGKKEFSQMFYLCHLIKKRRMQHLHAHFARLGATASMVASEFLKIPFSFVVHAHDIFVENDFLEEKIKKAKYVIAISKYNKEYLLKQYPDTPPNKIKVIHCGVDTEVFKPQPKIAGDGICLLSGGRFVEKKGFSYLIKACKLMVDKGVRFRCEVFGYGPLKERLFNEVKKLGLEEIIHLRGAINRDGLLHSLTQSDIFILPSVVAGDGDRDGIPVTLMEAMSGGKAVVSTDISGLPELICSGNEGILVPQRDEVSLAQTMMKLIEDGALRQRLGVRAREKIEEKFNLAKNVKFIADVFGSVE